MALCGFIPARLLLRNKQRIIRGIKGVHVLIEVLGRMKCDGLSADLLLKDVELDCVKWYNRINRGRMQFIRNPLLYLITIP
jgi:hypothetical protein